MRDCNYFFFSGRHGIDHRIGLGELLLSYGLIMVGAVMWLIELGDMD